MSEFWHYLGGTIIRPRDTFSRLLNGPQQLTHGTKAILLISVLYTLTVIGFAASKAKITEPAWVAIPPEEYYFWEIFFAMPVLILGWILAAGIVQLSSKWFRGRGTFESTLAVLGFAITVPLFVTWVPETTAAVLMLTGTITQRELLEIISHSGFWQIFSEVYLLVAVGWLFILIPIAVAIVQGLYWWQAIIVDMLIVVIFMFAMLVFIR